MKSIQYSMDIYLRAFENLLFNSRFKIELFEAQINKIYERLCKIVCAHVPSKHFNQERCMSFYTRI